MTDTLQAVYDVHDGTYLGLPGAERMRLNLWAREHNINVNDTYRIEIHLLDCPFARVFQIDRTENNRAYCPIDHDHLDQECEVALRKPYDLVISSLPPVEPAPKETD